MKNENRDKMSEAINSLDFVIREATFEEVEDEITAFGALQVLTRAFVAMGNEDPNQEVIDLQGKLDEARESLASYKGMIDSLKRDALRERIMRLAEKLNPAITPTSFLQKPNEVEVAFGGRDKILAIRLYRNRTGAGLADAKHMIESHCVPGPQFDSVYAQVEWWRSVGQRFFGDAING